MPSESVVDGPAPAGCNGIIRPPSNVQVTSRGAARGRFRSGWGFPQPPAVGAAVGVVVGVRVGSGVATGSRVGVAVGVAVVTGGRVIWDGSPSLREKTHTSA